MGTIADLLGFGQSNGPHYQLDYSTAAGAGITTMSQATLATTNGVSNIIYVSSDGASVVLRSDVDVDPIASNGYPRSEWREKATDGTTNRAFNPLTGDHTIEVLVLPMHLPPMKPSFVVCQLHDNAQDLIEIAIQPRSDFATTGKLELVNRINGTSSGMPKLIADFQWGTWLYCKIRVGAIAPGSAAGWVVSCNGVTTQSWDSSYPALSTSGTNSYYKSGMYLQTKYTGNGTGGLETDVNEYGEAAWRVFKTYHNGESSPFNPTFGTQAFDTVSNVRWGTKTETVNTGGTGFSMTPALPASLAAGDMMYAVVRARRTGGSSLPSTPSLDASTPGWTRIINYVSGISGTDLASHAQRFQLWCKAWASGDVAPQFNYSASTTTDIGSAQCMAVAGAKLSADIAEVGDQVPSTLNYGAASTTVMGPTAALPANAEGGALALALFAHEFNVNSGAVSTTSGDSLTWSEGGEGVGTTVSFQAWANDWAIVPTGAGQAITAKQVTVAVNSGKSASLLMTLAPANQHGRRRAA